MCWNLHEVHLQEAGMMHILAQPLNENQGPSQYLCHGPWLGCEVALSFEFYLEQDKEFWNLAALWLCSHETPSNVPYPWYKSISFKKDVQDK